MGILYGFDCKCGYSATLNLGGGIFSCREDRLPLFFSDEQLAPYHEAKKNGALMGIMIENEGGRCGECHELRALPVLKIYLNNDNTQMVYGQCSECDSPVEFFTEEVKCPRCGEKNPLTEKGFWD